MTTDSDSDCFFFGSSGQWPAKEEVDSVRAQTAKKIFKSSQSKFRDMIVGYLDMNIGILAVDWLMYLVCRLFWLQSTVYSRQLRNKISVAGLISTTQTCQAVLGKGCAMCHGELVSRLPNTVLYHV